VERRPGAYQAGLYEALSDAGIYPIADMAIAAIIAGNAPRSRRLAARILDASDVR